jgi:Uma2 family endonuclease
MSAAALKVPDEDPEISEDSTTLEVIGGKEFLAARPAQPHIHTASQLHTELNYRFGGFKGGDRGPGGWFIYHEPELKLAEDKVTPDIAGWRRERLGKITREAAFHVAPDWICEVLSPSTRVWDREDKMPFYAMHRVGHLWLVDPLDQLLEVFALGRRGWEAIGTFSGGKIVRAEPFEAVELDLSLIWPPL